MLCGLEWNGSAESDPCEDGNWPLGFIKAG